MKINFSYLSFARILFRPCYFKRQGSAGMAVQVNVFALVVWEATSAVALSLNT